MSACHGACSNCQTGSGPCQGPAYDDPEHFMSAAIDRAALLAEGMMLPCCEHCARECPAQRAELMGHLVPCLRCITELNATHGDGCQESAQRLWQVMVGDSAEELSEMLGSD